MKNKIITGKIVTIVTYPEYLSVLEVPHFGEYDNPRITKLTPCIKNNGKYCDLRTGREVKRSKNTQEWLNLSGTVFRYADGHNVLISKKLDGSETFIAKEIVENDISRYMIPRRVFAREKKTIES